MLGSEPLGCSRRSRSAAQPTRQPLAPGSLIWEAGAGSGNGWLVDVAEVLGGDGCAFKGIAPGGRWLGFTAEDCGPWLAKRLGAQWVRPAVPGGNIRRSSPDARECPCRAPRNAVWGGPHFRLDAEARCSVTRAARGAAGPGPQNLAGLVETSTHPDGPAHPILRIRGDIAIDPGVGTFVCRVLGRFFDAPCAHRLKVTNWAYRGGPLLRRGAPTSRVRILDTPGGRTLLGQLFRTEPLEPPPVFPGGAVILRRATTSAPGALSRPRNSASPHTHAVPTPVRLSRLHGG